MGRMTARERAKARAKERQEEKNNRGFGYLKGSNEDGFFIELNGKNKQYIDILPYEVTVDNHPDKVPPGEIWYKRPFYIHKDIGADNRRVICPLKTEGKPCPICEYRNMLLKEDGKTDETDALKPKLREIFNMRDADSPKDGIKILDISPFNFGELLDEEIDSGTDEEAGFFDLVDGFTLEIRWKQKSFNGGKFFDCRSISFEERDDLPEKILDETFNLDELLMIKSYDELKSLFHESVAMVDEEEEVESTDGEDDIPYDYDDDKEEEKDETPRRGRRNRNSDEDEENAERRPRRSSRDDEDEEDKTDTDTPSENECPADGVFGDDNDELKECEDCDKWEDCKAEQEKKKASRPSRRGRRSR